MNNEPTKRLQFGLDDQGRPFVRCVDIAPTPPRGPTKAQIRRETARQRRAAALMAARNAKPNDFGSYPVVDKRTPSKQFNGGRPLTPAERFKLLRDLFLAHRQVYRNGELAAPPKEWKAEHERRRAAKRLPPSTPLQLSVTE